MTAIDTAVIQAVHYFLTRTASGRSTNAYRSRHVGAGAALLHSFPSHTRMFCNSHIGIFLQDQVHTLYVILQLYKINWDIV